MHQVHTAEEVEIEPIITGSYDRGFWFDRGLYSVHVSAVSVEEAKRVAYSTATDSCQIQGKPLNVIRMWDSVSVKTSNNLLMKIGAANRPPFCELRFRCEATENPHSKTTERP